MKSVKPFLASLLLLLSPWLAAQPGGGNNDASLREAAPIRLEGYWISVVTEDWMFRMVTPPRGEYMGVPLSQAGRDAADAWDPEADIEAGPECKAYGAPALMRIPGRVRFSWENDSTLRIDHEAGGQSRMLHFNAAVPGDMAARRQGYSRARWDIDAGDRPNGELLVETDHLQPGYLRKNGVPYSADARVKEYYNVYDSPNGDTWLVITTEVIDPVYLTETFITSTHYKKLSDSAGERYWDPVPCDAR